MWKAQRTILRMLAELDAGAEMYGLELVKCSGGELRRGSIYVHLGQLELSGFVESREEPDVLVDPQISLPRRLYRITELGRAELREAE